jgi:pimeloyl-ACP methyl ester carboxylesterase
MKQHTIYRSEEGKQKILGFYESYFQKFDVRFERIYVKTRFGKTHTLVTGPVDGKPIFIFQGGNCINPMTLSWFSSLFSEYRIYSPDTIGHPGFSEEKRISAKDESFSLWISDLMDYAKVEKSAFIGPSYGAGIILRLATFMPDKIACSVLVSPSGIKLGSKLEMIRKILIPLLFFKMNGSKKHLERITNIMSFNSMNDLDKDIIGEIFKSVLLEQEMPKLTDREELLNYTSPTMVIAGKNDIFFPCEKVMKTAKNIIPNLTQSHSYEMGHFPSEEYLIRINDDIKEFLKMNYS